VLTQNETVSLEGGAVRLENQPPQSVRVIKLIDTGVAAAAPTVTTQVPATANAGETITLSATAKADGVPSVAYHWDFGDGTSADSPKASHAYTTAGEFAIHLTVDGVDGVPAQQNFSVKVTGILKAHSNLTDNRRFVDPTDR
jgi:alpha-galactosidase